MKNTFDVTYRYDGEKYTNRMVVYLPDDGSDFVPPSKRIEESIARFVSNSVARIFLKSINLEPNENDGHFCFPWGYTDSLHELEKADSQKAKNIRENVKHIKENVRQYIVGIEQL